MHIYVIAEHHVTGITTNSSSMLYVVSGKEKSIKLIENTIDEIGIRWWTGNIKVLRTVEELQEFCEKYSHMLNTLFGFQYHEDEPYEYIEDESEYQRDLRWRLADMRIKLKARRCALYAMSRLPIYYYAAGEDNEIKYESIGDLLSLPLRGGRVS